LSSPFREDQLGRADIHLIDRLSTLKEIRPQSMNKPSESVRHAPSVVVYESHTQESIAERIRRELLDEVVREKLMSSDLTTYARRGTY
jgi:hypothetical protein